MKPCPTCKTDIADVLAHPTINKNMADVIEKLKARAAWAHAG